MYQGSSFTPFCDSFQLGIFLQRLRASFILGLDKGVGDLFATVDGAHEDEEGASNDDETEGAGGLVAFVVC